MLGVSLATVATQCSVLLQYYITAAVSSLVILNSSLSSPGPGRGSRRHSEHVFTPFLTAALWLQSGSSSSQYSVFLMEAHLIFGLYTTAPPRPVAGNMISCRGSYFCQMVNILQDNYIQNTNHFYQSSQYFWSMFNVLSLDILCTLYLY